MFENENFGSVNGNASAPYISSIATGCGYATSYVDNVFSSNLVSLPHYLALLGFTFFGGYFCRRFSARFDKLFHQRRWISVGIEPFLRAGQASSLQ